ncbi:thiolase family protein [Natronorubrum aibiense]|uniref:Thiolase family protein n=1 Tax=Natronorubrum aibiense TaxID=348826 RepID=A0A5P9P989_9EURY|nr:thiolase family protein [Natronorubrum aibiense]QFU84693.1 thiolase family protein [Natronorubrum aibiense]
MTDSTTPVVAGVSQLPNGTYDIPERDLALEVILDALDDASLSPADLDGLYMSAPRAWTPQKFFSTYLNHQLGLDIDRAMEIATGGTSGGHAFHSAVSAVRSGTIDTAVVFAIERNSLIETTGPYFEYVLRIFDVEFQSPIGLSVPGVYAQSLQRYAHEHDVAYEDVAEIVVKNRENAYEDPNTLFDEPVTREDVLESRPIADPITLLECPAPCDGGAAVVVTSADVAAAASEPVEVAGIGSHHAQSHLLMNHDAPVTELPAVGNAARKASEQATQPIDEIDVFEPYAPFPHIEAIITEELGLADRGEGVDACLEGKTAPDGEFPISPSGGCLGRGHPPLVTPLLNHVEAVRQLRGTASTQIPDANSVMTTSEHGHVNGATATIFRTEA